MPKYFVKTWGCQMNVLDGDKIASLLEELGYEKADELEDANVILLNTCSVREGPEDKVFAELSRLKKLKKKNLEILGVAGCVAQQEKNAVFERAPYVDIVMGPRSLSHLPELLRQARDQRAMETSEKEDSLLFPPDILRRSHPTKASVTVMEGCNKRCSYCIVPETRGREVCRPIGSILEEVSVAVDRGYSEIELLGQNVNCWKHGGEEFTDLLDKVSSVAGVKRLKFMTSHPKHFPLEAARLMAERDNICSFLHLPLQAGSSRILKLMRRQYDRKFYTDLVAGIKAAVPGIVLSTDIIVAFPSETEDEFEESLECLREIRFDSVFSFRYSPRPGTPAAEMEPVPEIVARERHQRLMALQLGIQTHDHARFVGNTVEVLVEGVSKRGGQYMGRIPETIVVNFTSDKSLKVNSCHRVEILKSHPHSLEGRLADGA